MLDIPLALVVQEADNSIQWINHDYPEDKMYSNRIHFIRWIVTCPLFEQLGPGKERSYAQVIIALILS